MKRSEMIEIIQEIVNMNIVKYENFLDLNGASEVLLKIEEAGMLPPKRVNEKYDDENSN